VRYNYYVKIFTMNYQVPQFIEVEDKIVGPLTIKQFIYIAGGLGMSFAVYRFFPIAFLGWVIMAIIIGFSLALAFYKINNKPFINVVESAFKYIIGKKLYLWRKTENQKRTASSKKKATSADEDRELAKMVVPKLSESKLKDLAWSLDVQESLYSAYAKKNKKSDDNLEYQ
jgi:hypothetical protein